MKKHLRIIPLFLLACGALHAQTITDGLMMPKKTFCTGFMYGHDKWTDYWQGTRKRDNESIGSFTSKSVTWMGTYGVTKKLNVIAMLPYIDNKLSAGTLHGQRGLQDITVAVKYNLFNARIIDSTDFKAFAGLAYSMPVTNYVVDFLPLSLGSGTKRLAWRINLNYSFKKNWYANVSSAYTWRSNVTLDRDSYTTSGHLYSGSEVWMPNVADLFATIGYHKQALQLEASYSLQKTLGGDDIFRQDMPFVSNQMNFSKVGALVMYYLPYPKYLAVRATASYTIAGRNVGQTTSIMGGLMYTIFFTKDKSLKGLSSGN
ncbi:MAG TPA: hypothetical protein VIM65_14220 [Cyclobacteriaceae bacterium]